MKLWLEGIYLDGNYILLSYLYFDFLLIINHNSLEVTTRACTLFVFDVCRLLGLSESRNNVQNVDEDDLNLLRLMTPICKLFTAKKVIVKIDTRLHLCFLKLILLYKILRIYNKHTSTFIDLRLTILSFRQFLKLLKI